MRSRCWPPRGRRCPASSLGTGVVPVYPRHPMMLAQQALTVQLATGNRLILGIGLSHQVVVEGMWGLSFEKPARYMKEYLAALMPLLHGETVNVTGERVTTNAFAPLEIHGVDAPPVLVAALGDTMLKLAGRVADGTVTWMTGTRTIESHITPIIRAAAEKAGRPAPRIGVALPGVRSPRTSRRPGAGQQGVLDLSQPAVLQGDAGQGGGGRARPTSPSSGDEDAVDRVDREAGRGGRHRLHGLRRRQPRRAGAHVLVAQRHGPFGLERWRACSGLSARAWCT